MDSVSPSHSSCEEFVELTYQRNAASTYNLLFEEGRTVSAALCPLKPVDMRADAA